MLRASLLIACVGLSLASTVVVADVYKYKDEKGEILYTDRPQVLPAERLSVQTRRSDVVDVESSDDAKSLAERDKARKDTQKTQTDKKQAAETNAAGKAEACTKARQDYLSRMNAQRLFEEQPNGERRYLDEKELDAARASAKQAMDTLCN